ncbi:unnamed protein product [Prunus brigantina]
MSRIPYASAIGSLMYVMLCTKPDISYATVLNYLRRTKDMFLVYGGNPKLLVERYTDSDFEYDVDDWKSTYGYVFTMNGGAINWRCCKQSTTTDSTTEVEYIVASEKQRKRSG